MLLHQRANHQSCRPETITSENQYRVATPQRETGAKNHIVCSLKMYSPPEHNRPIRENIHCNKQHFGTR